MKDWTVAFVNYKTSVYLKWQLKALYEFNNPEEFDLIIVDNSRPKEKKELEKLTEAYQKRYNNISIIYYEPEEKSASGQHGEAMTVALKKANSKYFLANDPDFFWVKQNYLSWMKGYLEQGLVAIGAPYPRGVGLGNSRFPCAYGCAHPLQLIKYLDFRAESSKEKWEESLRIFPDKEYSFDVGYKIRDALSSEDVNDNFLAFDQEECKDLSKKIGLHSFEVISKKYLVDDEVVAFHLFRGSFTGKVVGNQDKNKPLSRRLKSVRDRMGRYFYEYLRTGVQPNVVSFRAFLYYCSQKIPFLKKVLYRRKDDFSIIKDKKKIYFMGLPLCKIIHREGNGTKFTILEIFALPMFMKREFEKDNSEITKISFFSFNIAKIVKQKKTNR